jgi:zinc transporter ZupT
VQDTAAVLWRVVPAFILAVAGGAISAMMRLSHERLCALISLAAGTLLGVTAFSILPESWSAMNWWEMTLAFGSGYFVFWFISKYVYHVCPACAASHFDEATTHRFSEIASALVIALAIHSTMDGVALAAGHEAHGHSSYAANAQLDWSLLLAVCVHKVPEGIASRSGDRAPPGRNLGSRRGSHYITGRFVGAVLPARHPDVLARGRSGSRRGRFCVFGVARRVW